MNFGTRGIYKIRTAQVPSEITALAHAVANLEPRMILELGTARAGTLLIWAQLASELVLSCDIKDRVGIKRISSGFPPPGSTCRVQLLTGDSHDSSFVEDVRSALGDRAVDFLFIDGDHSEAGVGADFENYGPLVRPGGLIAFHDIVRRQPVATNQVHPFWQRIKNRAEYLEFVGDPNQVGFGIGVIEVPENPTSLLGVEKNRAGDSHPRP